MLDSIVLGGNLYKIDGKLVRLFRTGREEVGGYDEQDEYYSWSTDEFMAKADLTDYSDFPSLAKTDPRLPYVFDLWWDVKRPSQFTDDNLSDPGVLRTIQDKIGEWESEPGSPLRRVQDVAAKFSPKLHYARALSSALEDADSCGLFDDLPGYAEGKRPGASVAPDVINEFIDMLRRYIDEHDK